jgi:hypothetical protein
MAKVNIAFPEDIHKHLRQWMYKCNIEVRSRNLCCSGKAEIVFYSESPFVVLFIQNKERMRKIIL